MTTMLFLNLLAMMTVGMIHADVAKLDFGEPGVNVQDGFIKLGLPDGDSGTYTGTFPYEGKTCTIKVSGYSHTRGNYIAVVNEYSYLSNLLRSSFHQTLESGGTISVEISGLEPSTSYEMKSYHHSTSFPRGGIGFTLQYDGNPINNLQQSANGQSPNPPLIHTETVTSSGAGKISFDMTRIAGARIPMDLNGLEIRGWVKQSIVSSQQTIVKNTKVATLETVGLEYRIVLEFYLNGFGKGSNNVIHFTTGLDKDQMGQRIPYMWVGLNGIFIDIDLNGKANSVNKRKDHLSLSTWYTVEIKQEKENGNYRYTILFDGATLATTINSKPEEFHNVDVWAGNPWTEYASDGDIRKLDFYSRAEMPTTPPPPSTTTTPPPSTTTTTPPPPTTTTLPPPPTAAALPIGPIDAHLECNENGFIPSFTYNNSAGKVVHIDVRIGSRRCRSTVSAAANVAEVELNTTHFGGGSELAYKNGSVVGCDGTFAHWNATNGNEKIKYEVGVEVVITETIRNTIKRKLKCNFTLICALSRWVNASTSGNWTIDNEDLVPAAATKEVKESFELATSLKFYQSSAYSTQHDRDFVAKNNDQIYMMVSEDNANDLFVFTVEKCWATAGSDAAEGDVARKDVFFTGQCHEDSTVKFSSNFTEHWFKLNLLSFYFPAAPTESIYVHCTLKICLQSGDCVQKLQSQCQNKNRKRRSVADVVETRTVTSAQHIILDRTEIISPDCGPGFIYDRVNEECSNQQLLEVKGIYLDIEWNPLYANTSSKVFREFAREKEYQLFAMLQASGRDRLIHGLKVIGATKGSVVLDVQLKYAESTDAVHAFREFEAALRTRPSTTRVMRILNVREDKTIEYVPIVLQEKPGKEKLVLVVVVVVLFVVVFISGITLFKAKQIRQRSPSGNPTAFDNKGVDA